MSGEAKDLLLRDYQYRAEALWKSEAAGETRVNLFVGLITFSAGALGTLISKEQIPFDILTRIVPFVCTALLVLGVVTFLRMIVRNNNTDLCKHQLDLIRQTYVDQFDNDGSWLHLDLFPNREGRVKKRDFGGLAHTVIAVNAMLFAAAFAPWLYSTFGNCFSIVVVSTLLLFCVAFSLQVLYLQSKTREFKDEMNRDYPIDTHAGGIVYAMHDNEAHYLTVKATRGDQRVLPKGHREAGESYVETALRELAEEAGTIALPQGFVGGIQFETTGERVRVRFYLMERLSDCAPCKEERGSERERREPKWEPIALVLKQLPKESQVLVCKAERMRLRIRSQAAPDPAVAAPGGT
jgi:8-oxo-dGTP pyrophosphatase MutT (NUDIX family)